MCPVRPGVPLSRVPDLSARTGPRAAGQAKLVRTGKARSVDQDKGPVPAGEMMEITEVDVPNALAARGGGSSSSSRGSDRAGGGEEEEGSSAGSGVTLFPLAPRGSRAKGGFSKKVTAPNGGSSREHPSSLVLYTALYQKAGPSSYPLYHKSCTHIHHRTQNSSHGQRRQQVHCAY